MKNFKGSDSLIVSGTLIVIALSRVLSIRDLYILGNFFQSFGQQLATIAAEQQLFLKQTKGVRNQLIEDIMKREFISKSEYTELMNEIKALEEEVLKLNNVQGSENGE